MAILNSYNYTKPAGVVGRPVQKVNVKSQPTNQVDSYLEAKVLSAKPEELTYMLYEGLVKFIKKAIICVEERQIEAANENTKKAQNIIVELRNTLNMEIPLSEEMDNLYEYMDYKLFDANIAKDKTLYEEALVIAEDFKNTWKETFSIN